MSLPELIPSDLPVFVRNMDRSNFSNSVVPQGASLLFTESDGHGGSILLMKKPDGTFKQIDGTTFYKCASVSSSTWQGKLASVDPVTGVWSFAEATVTRPIGRITPVVGGVYDADCTFEVRNYKTGIPESGLIFYLSMAGGIGGRDDTGTWPLNRDAAYAFQFTTQNGIPCAVGGGQLDVGVICPLDFLPIIPNDSTARYTISSWCAPLINADAGTSFGFAPALDNLRPLAVGNEVHWGNALLNYNNNQTRIYYMDNGGMMAFYHVTYDGSKIRWYKNRSLLLASDASTAFGENVSAVYPVLVQRGNWNYGRLARGAFAAFRIYNRLLDQLEVDALAEEFTPISEPVS